jgi:hypothetical protein
MSRWRTTDLLTVPLACSPTVNGLSGDFAATDDELSDCPWSPRGDLTRASDGSSMALFDR